MTRIMIRPPNKAKTYSHAIRYYYSGFSYGMRFFPSHTLIWEDSHTLAANPQLTASATPGPAAVIARVAWMIDVVSAELSFFFTLYNLWGYREFLTQSPIKATPVIATAGVPAAVVASAVVTAVVTKKKQPHLICPDFCFDQSITTSVFLKCF